MMRLVHYAKEPLAAPLTVRPQTGPDKQPDYFKPHGLWVSDDACPDNWKSWCEDQDFCLECLAYAYGVTLRADANVLVLTSAAEIDRFTDTYEVNPIPGPRTLKVRFWIDWPTVREQWDGLIITPYIWERRNLLSHNGSGDAAWYYSWDCASGCIWQPRAIASIVPREESAPKP
jgi:hypothetical protein